MRFLAFSVSVVSASERTSRVYYLLILRLYVTGLLCQSAIWTRFGPNEVYETLTRLLCEQGWFGYSRGKD